MITRTVKIKLSSTAEQKVILQETFDVCNKALNWISDMAWEHKRFGRVPLQYLVYYEVREKFGLPVQITLQLKDKVSASYKADKENKHSFKARILPINSLRTASIKGENIVSVNTLKGRIKIFMALGDFQKQCLTDKNWKIRDSELICHNRNYYLNLVLQRDGVEEFTPNGTLGVDRGIINIATLSTGEKFSGKKIKNVREKYFKLRKALQSKGTPSAKRKLKKISGKEKRFQKDCNHVIPKKIVDIANKYGWAIALEELKGIRAKDRGRRFNRTPGNWVFY